MTNLQDYFFGQVSKEAYQLFAVFARFEYAMKKGGFRRKKSPDAAWRTFAGGLGNEFFECMKSTKEAKIYFDQPPNQLILSDNSVTWSKIPKVPSTTVGLFESIKAARNNLFHGDKKHNRKRDQDLMIAALFILNAAYDAAEKDPKYYAFIAEMEFGL